MLIQLAPYFILFLFCRWGCMLATRKKEFYLKPADSASLCYCNDEVLLEPKKIQDYDRLTRGDTTFMLIAVCGEKFDSV